MKDARKQVDELNTELANALRSVANAESRAAIAEVLLSISDCFMKLMLATSFACLVKSVVFVADPIMLSRLVILIWRRLWNLRG